MLAHNEIVDFSPVHHPRGSWYLEIFDNRIGQDDDVISPLFRTLSREDQFCELKRLKISTLVTLISTSTIQGYKLWII